MPHSAAHDEAQVAIIADELERYLARHPDALDSADGILRWWLPRLRLEESAENLERALALLVNRGVVARWRLPGGRCVYASSSTSIHPDAPR